MLDGPTKSEGYPLSRYVGAFRLPQPKTNVFKASSAGAPVRVQCTVSHIVVYRCVQNGPSGIVAYTSYGRLLQAGSLCYFEVAPSSGASLGYRVQCWMARQNPKDIRYCGTSKLFACLNRKPRDVIAVAARHPMSLVRSDWASSPHRRHSRSRLVSRVSRAPFSLGKSERTKPQV